MAKKLAKSTLANRMYRRLTKRTKPGTGARFKAMTKSLKFKGATTPGGLAAWIGRRKYGPTKFAQMAAAGKKD